MDHFIDVWSPLRFLWIAIPFGFGILRVFTSIYLGRKRGGCRWHWCIRCGRGKPCFCTTKFMVLRFWCLISFWYQSYRLWIIIHSIIDPSLSGMLFLMLIIFWTGMMICSFKWEWYSVRVKSDNWMDKNGNRINYGGFQEYLPLWFSWNDYLHIYKRGWRVSPSCVRTPQLLEVYYFGSRSEWIIVWWIIGSDA